MKENVIKLLLAVLLSPNLAGAFAQQSAVPSEGKKTPDTEIEKGLKLIKTITPWSAAQIELMERQGDLPWVTAMALSPNGKLLAWGDREGNVFLWFSKEGRLVVARDAYVSRPPGHHGPRVQAIRFIQDSELVWIDIAKTWRAIIGRGKISDVSSKSHEIRMQGTKAIVADSIITCKLKKKNWLKMLKFPREYELRKYDLQTRKYQGTCSLYPYNKRSSHQEDGVECSHEVNVMALSPDDSMLAVASDNAAGIVRLKDFKLVQTFDVIVGEALAVSPANSRVAVGMRRGADLWVFDAASGKTVRKLDGQSFTCVAFETDDMLWFWSRGLRRLDIPTGQIKLFLKGPQAKTMLFDTDNRRIYLGGYSDGTVRICELP